MIREDKGSNRESELKGKGIVVRVGYLSIGGGGIHLGITLLF